MSSVRLRSLFAVVALELAVALFGAQAQTPPVDPAGQLSAFGYDSCKTLMGTSDAPFNVHWTVRGAMIDMAVEWTGNKGHWAAFGWNPCRWAGKLTDSCMIGADSIVSWISWNEGAAKSLNVRHTSGADTQNRQSCSPDGLGVCADSKFFPNQQNVNPLNVSGSWDSSTQRNFVRFTRPIAGFVSTDRNITAWLRNPEPVVYAIGIEEPFFRLGTDLVLAQHQVAGKMELNMGLRGQRCTRFAPRVRAPRTPCLWSNFACWRGGSGAAVEGQIVTVGEQFSVTLDQSPPDLAGLIINGELKFAMDRDLNLTSRWILVRSASITNYVRGQDALFEIGTEETPYQHRAIVTINGDNETVADYDVGGKFLAAQYGGHISMHGARRSAVSWTSLDETARVNATSIKIRQDVSSWRVGDQIVIAPTGFDPTEDEMVTITGISGDGKTVSFTPKLRFEHFAEKQFIDGVLIDETAEVGLLTRNILVQGSPSAVDIGAHMIIYQGGMGHVEGVEFFRMGQTGNAGRYPVHWHWVGAASGDYARNNSVHHSFHRAFVCHNTNYMLYENNVAYHVRSHAYVASEDGFEYQNIFLHNLMIHLEALAPEQFAFQNRARQPWWKPAQQSEWRPGAFWMRNQNQIIRHNHVAGIQGGFGFFFDRKGTGIELNDIVKDFVDFTHNVAHSIEGFTTGNDRYPPLTQGWGLFVQGPFGSPEKPFVLSRFFGWKCSLGAVWTEEAFQHVFDSISADNSIGMFTFRGLMQNVFIAGQTANRNGQIYRVGFKSTVTGGAGFTTQADQGGIKALRLRFATFYKPEPAVISSDFAEYTGTIGSSFGLKLLNASSLYLGSSTDAASWSDEDGSLCGNGVSNQILKFDTTSCKCPNRPFIDPSEDLSCPSTSPGPITYSALGYIAPTSGGMDWRPTEDPSRGFIRSAGACDSVICCPNCFVEGVRPNASPAEIQANAPLILNTGRTPTGSATPAATNPSGSGQNNAPNASSSGAPVVAIVVPIVVIALIAIVVVAIILIKRRKA